MLVVLLLLLLLLLLSLSVLVVAVAMAVVGCWLAALLFMPLPLAAATCGPPRHQRDAASLSGRPAPHLFDRALPHLFDRPLPLRRCSARPGSPRRWCGARTAVSTERAQPCSREAEEGWSRGRSAAAEGRALAEGRKSGESEDRAKIEQRESKERERERAECRESGDQR